jgi:heme exporter protein A
VEGILVVARLCKQIETKVILDQISFTAKTGDLIVVTGRNGAGKTTLLRVLAGLMPKTSGKILWNQEENGLKHWKIGYLSHLPMLYESLSVLDNLRFFAKLYGCWSLERGRELLTEFGLWPERYELTGVLSRGMKQRLALARALINDPDVILYDEPFTGLDREGTALLQGILKRKQINSIQILVAHDLGYVNGLDYRMMIIEGGKMVEEGITGV